MLLFIQQQAQQLSMPVQHMDQITLSAEEALVNIIHYAYPEQKGEIEIFCTSPKEKNGLVITLKDSGIPFDPTKFSKVAHDITGNKEFSSLGGFGIYLLISMMDEIKYERVDNKNCLTLTKYF